MKYGKFIEIIGHSVGDILFLSKSISDDETRLMMNFIYCENNQLIATDGRRMHFVNMSKEQLDHWGFKNNTFYEFLKGTKKKVWLAEIDNVGGMVFPNIQRVIPTGEVVKQCDFLNPSKQEELYKQIRAVSDIIPREFGLNIKYLLDLPRALFFRVKVFDTPGPILFESGNLTALMMTTCLD